MDWLLDGIQIYRWELLFFILVLVILGIIICTLGWKYYGLKYKNDRNKT